MTILTQPNNVKVCLSQTTTANFICGVTALNTLITSVGWQILDGGIYKTVVGRSCHTVNHDQITANPITTIIGTLTVTNVSLSDNGAKYRCRPVDDVVSNVVTLTVIGMYVIIGLYCCKHSLHNYQYNDRNTFGGLVGLSCKVANLDILIISLVCRW